ncbi:hypothetical protein J3R30DRAFT_3694791 [Lentinula aciculospora]|uniref:T6SS Phospholipase effector Tle1-like catalytic domain-containing protein n=1 Tax=Lentinula aciculospora TaxID=153920 RepID=A0A9W9AVQ8_9AGAR|nr:hypothetical protein J3R30DRAFT_3694791 [Lentinula aciculospora]
MAQAAPAVEERTLADTNTAIAESPTTDPFSSSDDSLAESVNSSLPLDNVIPPSHPYRTLVLCFDGTGDQFDADNSNIIQLFTILKKDDKSQQMVYYQAGIGTYTTPQVATPLMAKFSKALDEAIAWNLHAHVMGGYEFLMQNYSAGDRICIFGFSRGAYTARSLAGMIHKVGILPACNHQQVPFAYKMFTREDELGWKQSNAFKKAFSVDADIEFLGVWDTVSSVGIIPKRLPFTTSNTIVRTFRHAVSLDERRAKFKANLWNWPNAQEETLGISSKKEHKPKKAHKTHSLRALEAKYNKDHSQPTDVEEVWFAGCHCDVGGGSVSNDTTINLARIPLRWMIRECFKTNTGILFDCNGLRGLGMNPDALYPEVLPRPPPLPVGNACIQDIPIEGSLSQIQKDSALKNFSGGTSTGAGAVMTNTEEQLELLDALSPIYDQLSIKWFWWILEFFPIKQRFQRGDNSWSSLFGWNLGRGRIVPKQKKQGVKVHRSVKMRLEAQHTDGSEYQPKANVDFNYATWVD